MVTWTELFAFGMFLIALISLIVQIIDKKRSNRPSYHTGGYIM